MTWSIIVYVYYVSPINNIGVSLSDLTFLNFVRITSIGSVGEGMANMVSSSEWYSTVLTRCWLSGVTGVRPLAIPHKEVKLCQNETIAKINLSSPEKETEIIFVLWTALKNEQLVGREVESTWLSLLPELWAALGCEACVDCSLSPALCCQPCDKCQSCKTFIRTPRGSNDSGCQQMHEGERLSQQQKMELADLRYSN